MACKVTITFRSLGCNYVSAFIVKGVVELDREDCDGREEEHHHHEHLVHALVVSVPKSIGLKKIVQSKK